MARYVHLADARNASRIRRSGLRPHRFKGGSSAPGVYALPVLENFVVSHQWLRELKRSGARTLVGVYFQLDDDAEVSIGHYARPHRTTTAAAAAGFLRACEQPLGYEVIVPGVVAPRAITGIRHLPQLLGWRYMPGAHGKAPCGCPVCSPRGEAFSRKIKDAYD